jgi:DNA repair photolyase
MYDFITHTFNCIKGQCYHNCSYCYMHRFKQNPIHFDEKELKTNLGSGNFIFVGSSNDMFAKEIPEEWILKTLEHCGKFDNKYLFQTKNPENIRRILPYQSVVCVTLETNRLYSLIMKNSPQPIKRVEHMKLIRHPLYITIEPIMDFDLKVFVGMLDCGAIQINIGADSGGNHLPEPSKDKILDLISELKKFTTVELKKNLNRLLR